MGFMEDVQKACTEGADLWIAGTGHDGPDPFEHLVVLQEAVKAIAKAIQGVDNAKMVAVPAGMFAELVTLANIGKHVVAVRLVETGKLSADDIVMERTGEIGEL